MSTNCLFSDKPEWDPVRGRGRARTQVSVTSADRVEKRPRYRRTRDIKELQMDEWILHDSLQVSVNVLNTTQCCYSQSNKKNQHEFSLVGNRQIVEFNPKMWSTSFLHPWKKKEKEKNPLYILTFFGSHSQHPAMLINQGTEQKSLSVPLRHSLQRQRWEFSPSSSSITPLGKDFQCASVCKYSAPQSLALWVLPKT